MNPPDNTQGQPPQLCMLIFNSRSKMPKVSQRNALRVNLLEVRWERKQRMCRQSQKSKSRLKQELIWVGSDWYMLAGKGSLRGRRPCFPLYYCGEINYSFQLHPRELRNLQGSVIRFYQAAEDANLLGIISSFSPNSILRVQS